MPSLGLGQQGGFVAGDEYNLTQDIGLGEARGTFRRAANDTVVRFSSFVADSANVLVSELTVTTTRPQAITVTNMVYNLSAGRNDLIAGSVGASDAATMWGLRADDKSVQSGLRAGIPLRMSLVTRVSTSATGATTAKPSAAAAAPVCNGGGALCDAAGPPRNGVVDHSRCQCTTVLQLPAGTTTVTILTASASIFNVRAAGGANLSEVPAATALLPDAAAVPRLRAEHRAWWGEYWNASSVSFPSQPIFEDYYFRSLYLLGSSARNTSLVPPGLCGAWFAGSGPSRYGDFTLNYNFQAIWYGAYSSNHADTATPYYRAILDYANGPGLADAKQYNCSGTHLPGHIAPFGYGTCGDMQQHSDASFAALGFVRHWEYTRNNTFLREVSYPFLKNVAEWWSCWLKKLPARRLPAGPTSARGTAGDGYVLQDGNDCARESCCVAFPCSQGPACPTCRVMTTNPAQSITFITRIFKHLVEASAALGTDAALRAEWNATLAHMPTFTAAGTTAPYPLGSACPNPNTTACPPGGQSCPASSGPHCNEWKGHTCPGMVECSAEQVAAGEGTTVLLPQEKPFYFKPGDNPLQLYAAWPGEQLSLSSPPELLAIARDTVRLSDCWNEGNAPPEVYPAAVRVGYDTDFLYGNLTATLTQFLDENGQVKITFPMEGIGTTVAITDMLLQSHEGFLRFFPVVRRNESAAFTDLRANGAFLVSATFSPSSAHAALPVPAAPAAPAGGGAVSGVRVKSEAGVVCRFLSPWPGTAGTPAVRVVPSGTSVAVRVWGDGYAFSTAAGEVYSITPAQG